jgi:hypothetical protein
MKNGFIELSPVVDFINTFTCVTYGHNTIRGTTTLSITTYVIRTPSIIVSAKHATLSITILSALTFNAYDLCCNAECNLC